VALGIVPMVRVWVFVAVLFAGLGFAAWASDFVTMQGERTVYTVDCLGGAWQGDQCGGHLVAGARYRYRALKPHREVIFWTVGTKEPSGKFEDCEIQDGRNWVCRASADAARSITLRMAQGAPVPENPQVTRPFRSVSKWRWLLLTRGITADRAVPVAIAPAAAR
jgi:hypothetical protein